MYYVQIAIRMQPLLSIHQLSITWLSITEYRIECYFCCGEWMNGDTAVNDGGPRIEFLQWT